MKNTLIIITCFASFCLSGCSISEWSLVHRIDIQQGNVISQDVVDQLEPGMTRRQVQFVAGSPMVADVFHQDRWDYIYYLREVKKNVGREHVSLYFENDVLARISGSLRPTQEDNTAESESKIVSLVVPTKERVPPGILNRFWHWITFRDIEDTQP